MIGETISHYRIEARLGQGGMGVVYLARDTKLDRAVALKFLAPELTGDGQARQRFLREARATAALNHPNIVTIYEIDEADGRTFIAMEHIRGESLRDKLAAGPLSAGAARDITCQIARGLAWAHARGIVHRDVKPGNILLTEDGQVKIVDFGLAMLADQSQLTQTGATLGTAAYMSPEQARGDEVTHLTDIWALGVIHYEMLTGRLPFRGGHALAQIYSILNADPEPLGALASGLSPEHETVTLRALAKSPADRFQTAGEMERALLGLAPEAEPSRETAAPSLGTASPLATAQAPTIALRPARPRPRLLRLAGRRLLGLGLLAAAGAVAALLIWKAPGGREFQRRDWLLVTEFKDLSATSGLQSALREALIVDLQQSRHVNVFAGQRLADALARMGQPPDAPITPELGAELAQREGIPVVLTGSVSVLGDNLLVAAQLVSPATGENLLATRVPAAGEAGLLPALDGLSRAIRKRLGESLRAIRAHDEPLAAVTTPSLEALRLFSAGNRAFLASDWAEALALFGQAVAQDSSFAMAHAKLARIHFYNANTLDALAHSELANRWRNRLTARERLYIEAEHFRYRAQYGEAIERLQAMLQSYPDDLEGRTNLATTHMWAMQYDKALQALEEFDAGARDTWYYHHTLGNALGGGGDYEGAAASFRRALALNPSQLRSRMCLAWTHLCRGDPAAGLAQLDTLDAGAESGAIGVDYLLAKTLPVLGRFEQTLARLESARRDALARGNRNQTAWTHIYAGDSHRRRGDEAAARREFAAAADIWPGDDPLCELGKTLARLGDLVGADRARAQLAALAEREPTQTHRQYLLKLDGEIAFARGDAPRAIALLEQCLPNYLFNLDARFTLGQAHLAAGDTAAARREFSFLAANRYSTLLEGHASLWPLSVHHLGLTAAAAGDTAAARTRFAEFLRLWSGADDGLPEIAEARRWVSAD